MSLSSTGPARQLSAGQRTALLHHMLVVRHLAEHHAGVPTPNPTDLEVGFRVGEEAAAVGILTALGPCDAMVPAAALPRAVDLARDDLRSRRLAVTVCLFCDEDGDWQDVARRTRLPILFCRRTGGAVDATDVETVLPVVRESLHLIRAGGGPAVLGLRATGLSDPVTTLVVRMTAAHQLDENALRAIDADAVARVAATLAGRRLA